MSKATGHSFSEEKLQDAMLCVLEHHVKHHQIVFRKLGHAQKATTQSIEEMQEIISRLRNESQSRELTEIKKFDKLWQDVIELFENAGLSEEELFKIEDILLTIPKMIKKYYETLVVQDEILNKLSRELKDLDYDKSIKIVREVQDRPNPMTGLEPGIYDLETAKTNIEAKIFTSVGRTHRNR